MLLESFITSIRAQPKSANTAIKKDIGIYVHDLHPHHTIKSSFKKSSSSPNSLAASSTHIFAAQADKAVVHVYSKEKSNQEALISFPERIHAVTLIVDEVLALGTAEGRIILWEVSTGRQITTPASHLQPVSCLASTQSYLLSGSDDSNVHVWSVSQLLSLGILESHEPLQTLSNHRAAITSIALGHSVSSANICVTASRDNTIIVWNYYNGDLLRTYLLPSTPLCLALDPCDRAVYAGFEDGSLQFIEFISPSSRTNPLYDTRLQTTPVQVADAPWVAPSETGASLCIGLSYDGTTLLSGHESGKVTEWDTGRRMFAAELADLNSPVTNLLMGTPFTTNQLTKYNTVVKPKLTEGNYTVITQLTGSIAGKSCFEKATESFGFPQEMLSAAIEGLYKPEGSDTSVGEDKLRKENEELWKVVNEQCALQQKTWEKYTKLKAGGG